MRQLIACGLALVLLAGCATFEAPDTASRPDILERDTTPVSLQQMRLLQVGEWYAVRLPEKEGRSGVKRGVYYSGYVGRLQSSDDDSLTLNDVVKCTDFDSRSFLRHLPIVGERYECGWMDCKNQLGTVTITRTDVMWFQPISEQEADKFRRYEETLKDPFQLEPDDLSDSLTCQFGVLAAHMPNVDFLLPNLRSEECRVQHWMELREVKPGHWYNVIPGPERRLRPHDVKVHVAQVDHVDEDGIYFKNVTTGSAAYGGSVGSEKTGDLMLRFTEIDRVIAITPEQAQEQIEVFNHPRELPASDDDE